MTMYTPELVTAAMQEHERQVAQLLHIRREERAASPRSGPFAGGLHVLSDRVARIACATGLCRSDRAA